MIDLPAEQRDRLRTLRLWHWRRVLVQRKIEADANKCGFAAIAAHHKREGDDHLLAVQTLNDFFASGDTAERDEEMGWLAGG